MPDDTAVHPVTFKIEAFNPVVRVDDQTFVPSIIEMVTKEAFQGILRQLILAELPKQMVAAVGNGKGCLRLFVSGIFKWKKRELPKEFFMKRRLCLLSSNGSLAEGSVVELTGYDHGVQHVAGGLGAFAETGADD